MHGTEIWFNNPYFLRIALCIHAGFLCSNDLIFLKLAHEAVGPNKASSYFLSLVKSPATFLVPSLASPIHT